MRKSFFFFSLLFFSTLGCGGAVSVSDFDASISTQSLPFVKRVSPAGGQAGDTVTLFGFGFSSAPANNIIHIGGTTATATNYALVNPPADGEIESLTFTLPAGATAAAANISVTVFDFTSNTDVQFTVNP